MAQTQVLTLKADYIEENRCISMDIAINFLDKSLNLSAKFVLGDDGELDVTFSDCDGNAKTLRLSGNDDMHFLSDVLWKDT